MSGSTEKSDYSALHHMPNHMPWSVTLPNENGQDQEYWLGPIEKTYSSPSFNRDYVTSWNYFALKIVVRSVKTGATAGMLTFH